MTTKVRSSQQKFVDAALTLFSERGYYGVSLADVASELGLTKQSVLYHFPTKEALYGEVLQQLSNRFEAIVAEARALVVAVHAHEVINPDPVFVVHRGLRVVSRMR